MLETNMETLSPEQQNITVLNQGLELDVGHSEPVSRASKLATELAAEKRRLQQDLRELQAENDDLKPTTPTGTVDWYVKWFATILSVSGIFLMSAGFSLSGQIAYAVSAAGWVFVGIAWNDRAIMIGSSICATAVLLALVQGIG
ncbi:MAG TPA: hypothetical protein DER02_00030 [Gammaproteobacteria bacterium]|nr:hypothetical protein [Gammaproteobacteria bacterium]|tara:strand:+ start:177 stop:608 length:432 start_codon:yes stop_codon:yes gene_type:complete